MTIVKRLSEALERIEELEGLLKQQTAKTAAPPPPPPAPPAPPTKQDLVREYNGLTGSKERLAFRKANWKALGIKQEK